MTLATESVPVSPTSTILGDSDSWSSGCSTTSTLLEVEADPVSAVLVDAIVAGDVSRVRFLIDQGAQLAPSGQWTLYQACLYGSDMVHALLSPGIQFDKPIRGEEGESVIHFLLRTPGDQFRDHKADVIRLLLNHGVSAVMPGRLGDTPLHTVAGQESPIEAYELMMVLLGNDDSGDPFISDREKYVNLKNDEPFKVTPLIVAIMHGNYQCVKLLLENGADASIKGEMIDGERRSPMYFATRIGHAEIIKLLLKHRAGMDQDAAGILTPALKRELAVSALPRCL